MEVLPEYTSTRRSRRPERRPAAVASCSAIFSPPPQGVSSCATLAFCLHFSEKTFFVCVFSLPDKRLSDSGAIKSSKRVNFDPRRRHHEPVCRMSDQRFPSNVQFVAARLIKGVCSSGASHFRHRGETTNSNANPFTRLTNAHKRPLFPRPAPPALPLVVSGHVSSG